MDVVLEENLLNLKRAYLILKNKKEITQFHKMNLTSHQNKIQSTFDS